MLPNGTMRFMFCNLVPLKGVNLNWSNVLFFSRDRDHPMVPLLLLLAPDTRLPIPPEFRSSHTSRPVLLFGPPTAR